ncbi:Rieske 2Fe-2S domain-containing protein [Pseudonocardia sp.]
MTDDNCIQCPFHGWNWDYEGRNTHIPYSARAPCATSGCGSLSRPGQATS